jgi:hypothetical protein
MSWSVSKRGKASEVAKQLEAESANMSGQSRVEFDAAKPYLIGLIKENFNNRDGSEEPTVSLDASGHGMAQGDAQLDRTCQVTLRRV